MKPKPNNKTCPARLNRLRKDDWVYLTGKVRVGWINPDLFFCCSSYSFIFEKTSSMTLRCMGAMALALSAAMSGVAARNFCPVADRVKVIMVSTITWNLFSLNGIGILLFRTDCKHNTYI